MDIALSYVGISEEEIRGRRHSDRAHCGGKSDRNGWTEMTQSDRPKGWYISARQSWKIALLSN